MILLLHVWLCRARVLFCARSNTCRTHNRSRLRGISHKPPVASTIVDFMAEDVAFPPAAGLLTELRLGDFPGWEGAEPIRLAPVTLFYGQNGSGKSALLHAVCHNAAGPEPELSPRRLRRGARVFEEILGHWLTVLGIVDEFSVAESLDDADVWELRVKVQGSEAHVPVTRAGTGAVHALLVLVQAFSHTVDAPVHLDHPESHLQPFAQSALGDALIAAATTHGTQLLVETHSDRLLRRLQRRIAEGRIDADDVAVYLIETHRHAESNIQQLVIDSHGNIANWPHDFFGDEMRDLVAMAKGAAERRGRDD